MSLANLNSSGIQSSNPALYQTIKDLYDLNFQLTNLLNSLGFTLNPTTNQLTLANPLTINQSLIVTQLLTLLQGQIQFPSVQNPSTDPNTLDDYAEGVWTPNDVSGAGLVFATFDGSFVKIGKVVHLQGYVLYPANASGLAARLSTPFVTSGDTGLALRFSNSGASFTASMPGGQSFVEFYTPAGVNKSNANLATFFVAVSGTYRVTA